MCYNHDTFSYIKFVKIKICCILKSFFTQVQLIGVYIIFVLLESISFKSSTKIAQSLL